VEPGSLAAQEGVGPKDVIVDVNDKPIQNVRDFQKAMDDGDVSEGIRLRVMRDGVSRFVILKSSR
jgi:S1-C subfamily serine protease